MLVIGHKQVLILELLAVVKFNAKFELSSAKFSVFAFLIFLNVQKSEILMEHEEFMVKWILLKADDLSRNLLLSFETMQFLNVINRKQLVRTL